MQKNEEIQTVKAPGLTVCRRSHLSATDLRAAAAKADDSLAQQGRPFHQGGDTPGRSPRLNGTPLSDCQSRGC